MLLFALLSAWMRETYVFCLVSCLPGCGKVIFLLGLLSAALAFFCPYTARAQSSSGVSSVSQEFMVTLSVKHRASSTSNFWEKEHYLRRIQDSRK
jgi:hypothetical protein